MTNKKTFIKITNQDIYDKLIEVEMHVLKTNGKVKLNRWISTSALTFIFIIIGWIINVYK